MQCGDDDGGDDDDGDDEGDDDGGGCFDGDGEPCRLSVSVFFT